MSETHPPRQAPTRPDWVLTSWGKSKKENTRDWRIHGIHACHGLQKKRKTGRKKREPLFWLPYSPFSGLVFTSWTLPGDLDAKAGCRCRENLVVKVGVGSVFFSLFFCRSPPCVHLRRTLQLFMLWGGGHCGCPMQPTTCHSAATFSVSRVSHTARVTHLKPPAMT